MMPLYCIYIYPLSPYLYPDTTIFCLTHWLSTPSTPHSQALYTFRWSFPKRENENEPFSAIYAVNERQLSHNLLDILKDKQSLMKFLLFINITLSTFCRNIGKVIWERNDVQLKVTKKMMKPGLESKDKML